MGFDVVDGDFNASLFGGDAGIDHHAVGDLAEAHGDEIGETNVSSGEPGPEPDAEEREHDAEDEQSEDRDDDEDDGGDVEHGVVVS